MVVRERSEGKEKGLKWIVHVDLSVMLFRRVPEDRS